MKILLQASFFNSQSIILWYNLPNIGGKFMDISINEHNNNFVIPMNYYEGKSLDNESVISKRFTFVLIERGSGFLSINNKEIFYIAPVIFCLNERERIVINDEIDIPVKVVFFHPNVINDCFDFNNIRSVFENASVTMIQDREFIIHFIERNERYFGKINIGPITYRKFDKLFQLLKKETTLQNRDNWPCRSRSYLFEILFLIDNIYSEGDTIIEKFEATIDEEFNDILTYIYNNYNDKITIDLLTKKFNINRTTLSEKFSKLVGESLITYLNKLRINMASILLRDTKLPIAEIMGRVGFNDATHFLRTFKKYKEMSPSEYRSKYCWM